MFKTDGGFPYRLDSIERTATLRTNKTNAVMNIYFGHGSRLLFESRPVRLDATLVDTSEFVDVSVSTLVSGRFATVDEGLRGEPANEFASTQSTVRRNPT